MKFHDPAGCQLPECRRCADFFEGYSVGKAKTHFELRNLDHDPAVGCGCEPCKTARIVRARRGAAARYAVRDVSGRNMDKRSAMNIVNKHLGSRLLDGGNTSFANINASKPVWWININPSKFKSDLHLLLVKEGDRGLIWLRIEGDSFPDVRKVFKVRQDNDYIDLEISSRRPEYMTDVKSGGTEYDFAKHIEHEWGPAQHGRVPRRFRK